MSMVTYYAMLVMVLVVLATVAASSIRIAKEYERGVVFRLGRMIPLRGPGLFFIFPLGIDRVRMVDLRVVTLEVPARHTSLERAVSVALTGGVGTARANGARLPLTRSDPATEPKGRMKSSCSEA